MLFYFENLVILFEPHADFHIKSLVRIGFGRIVGIFHIFPSPRAVGFHIDTLLHKCRIQIFDSEEAAGQIHHWACITVTVSQCQRGDVALTRNTEVVCTEGTGNMHNTRTILCCHIITGDYAECPFSGIHPRQKLFIMHPDKF